MAEEDADTVPATAEGKKELKLGVAMQRIAVEEGISAPKTLEDQVAVAAWAVKSGLLPTEIDTPGKAWMVMERGGELGFPGLTAFEFLYVVKGRVRLTPDGAKAKALASGLLEDYTEEVVGTGDHMLARVTLKRRGIPTPVVSEFSVQDAKDAKLWGKTGPRGDSAWVTYPKRMLKARARGFAFQDAFRDVIGGLQVRERYDLEPGEAAGIVPTGRIAATPPPPPGPDPLLDEIAPMPKTQCAKHAEELGADGSCWKCAAEAAEKAE